MLADIESLEIPVRILEDDVFEKVVGHGQRPRTARGAGPAQLAARLEAGKNFLAGFRVDQRRVDFFGRLDLSGREAIRAVGAFALRHRRVEFAVWGIADDTVLDAVARIAGVESGLVQHGIFFRRNPAGRILERGLGDRYQLKTLGGAVVTWIAGDDAFEIGGKTLRLHESLPAASRAAGEVR